MRTIEDVRSILAGKYHRNRSKWLLESLPGASLESGWPIAIPLKPPVGRQIETEIKDFLKWRDDLEDFEFLNSRIVYIVRKFQMMGQYKVPATVNFESPEAVAAMIGADGEWGLVKGRFLEMSARRPAIAAPLSKSWRDLATMDEADFRRLAASIEWLAEYSGQLGGDLYLRQVSIPGVDTKWLETHESLVLRLLRPALGFGEDVQTLVEALGLRKPQNKINLRLLDPALRALVGGVETMTVSVEEAAKFPLRPSAIIIVENEKTGLAFSDLPGCVLFYGHGKNLAFLGILPWLKSVPAFYWGDLDTHGLGMLSQARGHLPGLKSFLMDRETFLAHREFWVKEPRLFTGQADNLTKEEGRLLENMRRGLFGQNARLEQELIKWETAWNAILKLA